MINTAAVYLNKLKILSCWTHQINVLMNTQTKKIHEKWQFWQQINCLFAWVVLLVTEITTHSVVRQHIEVFFSQWFAVFVLVHTANFVTFFQSSSNGFQSTDSNPLFSNHGILSSSNLGLVGIVNVVKGHGLWSVMFFYKGMLVWELKANMSGKQDSWITTINLPLIIMWLIGVSGVYTMSTAGGVQGSSVWKQLVFCSKFWFWFFLFLCKTEIFTGRAPRHMRHMRSARCCGWWCPLSATTTYN